MEIQRKSKDKNTFKFKSFADRVAEIDIRRSALYYIGHENEELCESNETYFHQTIKKWTVLNLTEEFNVFSRKCIKIVTLPQLIHKEEFVIDLLLEKLSIAGNLSLQPFLEILAALARDLREDFYSYFQRVLDRLLCLLNTKDADQLEWTLICLAYLFKTLKPFLKKNINIVFHSILPLLDEDRYSEDVINFAVECFSFIARDIKEYEKLLDIILSSAKDEQIESVHGCGRLFFEIVRGVQGVFHNVAEKFLKTMFEGLLTLESEKKDLLFEIASSAVGHILQFIHPDNVGLLWKVIHHLMEKYLNGKEVHKVNPLVLLMIQIVQWKSGRFLAEMETLIPVVLKTIHASLEDSHELLGNVSTLVSSVLMSRNAKVSQMDTSRLIKNMLQVDDRQIFEFFILSIALHPQFEILVLPGLLSFVEFKLDAQSLELMVQVIMKKSHPIRSGRRLGEWKRYPLTFKKKKTWKKINDIIERCGTDIADNEDGDEDFLLLLILAPHINGLNTVSLNAKMHELAIYVFGQIDKGADKRNKLLILSLLIECGVHLELVWEKGFLSEVVSVILKNCDDDVLALEILDLISVLMPNAVRKVEGVPETLGKLLCSKSHEIRSLSAHSLSCYYANKFGEIYKIFYDTISIEPTIFTYRDQILLLQKLGTTTELIKSLKSPQHKKDILRFLLGMLRMNFKLLWESVLQLVQEYSRDLPLNDFWLIFKEQLEESAIIIRERENIDTKCSERLWKTASLNTLQIREKISISEQEAINYRNLLWSKISTFGNLREVKNRELITLFLKFVHEEYLPSQHKKILTCDITTDDKRQTETNRDDDEEEEPISKTAFLSYKAMVSTLMSKMSVFVKMPNPKQLHREPELYSFYMDLLSGSNADLQKIALDCVMSYNNKSITTYKDHLYAMIDDKRFKDELVAFKIDHSSGMIQSDHRQDLMQVLLRILYGKMTSKASGRNISSQVRKSMVLKFLRGCTTDEILWFLKMAFGIYDEMIETDLEGIPNTVRDKFNPSAVWSPKKLRSAINLLELIRSEFGGLMEPSFLIYMLKLITFIGAVCKQVIDSSPNPDLNVHSKLVTVFKNLKNITLLSLVKFSEHFENFPWTESQINTLTDVFVWDTVSKLAQDSIHSPTPVLKILLQWGQNVKCFHYLSQTKNGQTLFHYVVELLLNDKSKAAVRIPIMTLIEQLLMTTEGGEDTRGIDIIRPEILQILKRLKMNFSNAGRRRGVIDKRDLNILSLLAKHVNDKETCSGLLQLLFPILISKSQTNSSEDVVCQVITTLSSLILKTENPEAYLIKIAPFFEQAQEVATRKMLCKLLMDIAKARNIELLKDSARIIEALNAWDRRWVEQPDYDKRLAAFKAVKVKLENAEMGVDLNLGVLIIYNCFHFLRYDKDLGLRDNASEHLRLLVPKLIESHANDRKNLDYLVGEVLFNLIKRCIRDPSDNIRQEGIKLLGEMARKCPTRHPVLGDLNQLADAQDLEVDFFENLMHLQSHRHGRALLKFCTIAKSLSTPFSCKTLTAFIMPLASRYLLNEKYAKKHTLIDAAIEALGMICELLPWDQYQAILSHYLQKLRTNNEYQKHCVRIVVRILDAFHFDLSQATGDQSHLQTLRSTVLKEEAKNESIETAPDEVKEDPEPDEESLDSDLENIKDEAEEVQQSTKQTNYVGTPVVLEKNAARRVMNTITAILLPTLNRSITEKTSYDAKHKVNRKRFSYDREEEEMLRVPIGLALVKVMQKLPKEVLDSGLPQVIIQVCTFLKSPLKSVRMLTRDILRRIMFTLGSSYLSMIIDHLMSLLTRGFQVHVLSVTLHGIIDVLKDILLPQHLAPCLESILKITLNDIFGDTAAEKEVTKIAAHTPEAKASSKSFLVLHIIARNIQESCLLDILLPFKEHLAKGQSIKITMKIQECFQKIVSGLVENPHISRETLLIFIHGTISESITDLLPGDRKPTPSENEKDKKPHAKEDCFIIPPEPKYRSGAVTKKILTNTQANAHILIAFGLEMLHFMLKRKKLSEIAYESFLNPLLPHILDSLKSVNLRVTTLALKCITSIWNEEYELPKLNDHMDDIVTQLFTILNNISKYANTKQSDNLHLVKNSFKCVVALLRKCVSYELNDTHISQLTFFIQHEFDNGNESTAFSLLSALVNRRIDTQHVHEIMLKLREIVIITPDHATCEKARSILFTYLMEYTLKQRLEPYIKFFTRQLSYSMVRGRMSAIRMLSLMVKQFPVKVLERKAQFLFISLGTRLVNDDDTECRKSAAECMELLLSRLDKNTRQSVFDVVLVLLQHNSSTVREMGAMMCSRFLHTEKTAFEPRIVDVLPIIVAGLMRGDPKTPGRFVKMPKTKVNTFKKVRKLTEEELDLLQLRTVREIDHELIQMQNCILKILDSCPDTLRKEEFNETIDDMAYECKRLLAYEHEWVRINAVKILTNILASYDFDLVAAIVNTSANKNDSHRDFIYLNPQSEIKSLVLDLCAQVVPGETNPSMMNEITKVFLYVAYMLRDVPFESKSIKSNRENPDAGESSTQITSKINVHWLMKRILTLAFSELSKAPQSCVARSAIFEFVEGLITLLSAETVEKLGFNLLAMLLREMSEDNQNVFPDLRRKAIKVANKIKKTIGDDVYDQLRNKVQRHIMLRRAERKKLIAQEKMNDPVRAAKRKQSMQERKKASKKRKIDVMRGKIAGKKPRKRKADDE